MQDIGLGLAAPRHEIEAFALREGFIVRSWHQDVQTGSGAGALLLRPGFAACGKLTPMFNELPARRACLARTCGSEELFEHDR